MKTVVNIKEDFDSITFRLRDTSGVSFTKLPFLTYFYIKQSDFEEVEFLIKNFLSSVEEVFDSNNNCFVKVILNSNFSRYQCRKMLDERGVQTFLADISAPKRWLLDNIDIKLHQEKLFYCFMDIETVDLFPLEKNIRGEVESNQPILSIAFKDRNGEEVYLENRAHIEEKFISLSREYLKKEKKAEFTSKYLLELKPLLEKHEKNMLLEFLEYTKIYDLQFAWNGDRFDFPYLKQRMEFHGIEADKFLPQYSDYMVIYKKNGWGTLQSYSLNNVSKHELQNIELNEEEREEFSKIDWKEKTGCNKIFELYCFEREVLKEYNIQDVRLMYLIEKKLKFFHLHSVESDICHVLFNDTLYNSKLCDMYILNEYNKKNIFAISKPTKKEVEERSDKVYGDHVSGGYTYCYEKGLHTNVYGFDFASHYPTAIITHNIGKDSFEGIWKIHAEKILNENELLFYESVLNLYETKEFLGRDGNLLKGKYEKKIEELKKKHNSSLSMEDIMWKFVEEYNDDELKKYLKEKNFTASDFDLNYDTKGWRMHHYRIYNRKESVLSKICRTLLIERNKVKYSLKKYKEGSAEWVEKNLYQLALKTLANSIYGVTGLKIFREYDFNVADAITSSCRMLTKRCILIARKNGAVVTSGDTDSIYFNSYIGVDELEKIFYDYFNQWIEQFNPANKYPLLNKHTNKIEEHSHAKLLEYEKTLDAVIVVAKKRYYFKSEEKYNSKGGAYIKSDTIQIAAELQKELSRDILDLNFNKEEWKEKMLHLKEKTYNFELERDVIISYAAISRNIEEYGQPIIDKNTGQHKKRKSDGAFMYAPIPAHIKVAKKMKEEGEEIEIGDKIPYVVGDLDKCGRIVPYSLKEFEEKQQYSAEYYWEKIFLPLVELLQVVYPEDCFTYFGECWGYTQKQLERKIKKLEEENEE